MGLGPADRKGREPRIPAGPTFLDWIRRKDTRVKKQINKASGKLRKGKRGRPSKTKPIELADRGERKEILKVCNDLAIILKGRAILDKSVRYAKKNEHPKEDIENTESTLAHFENVLYKELPKLQGTVERLHNNLRDFKSYLYSVTHSFKGATEEQISDFAFALDDEFDTPYLQRGQYEPSMTHRNIAFNVSCLAKYFRSEPSVGPPDSETSSVGNCYYWVFNVFQGRKCPEGRDRTVDLKAFQQLIDKYKDKAPVERATRIVADIYDISFDHVRRLRREYERAKSGQRSDNKRSLK